jgi:hypothetical protein
MIFSSRKVAGLILWELGTESNSHELESSCDVEEIRPRIARIFGLNIVSASLNFHGTPFA